MATSLVDLVGLGNGRAVANAEQEVLRRRGEDRIVADLMAALVRHGAANGSSRVDRAAADARTDAVGPAA